MKAGQNHKTAQAIPKITFNESNKLTDALISKLKPKEKAYIIRDTDLIGFWLRVPTNVSEATYMVATKPRGSRDNKRLTIGKASLYKASDARAVAREWLQTIKNGDDPKQKNRRKQAQSQRLKEAYEQYISDRSSIGKLSEASITNYRVDMGGRLAPLMEKRLHALSEELIVSWYRKGIQTSKSQTDRAYRQLCAVLNYQVALKNMESNPAKTVQKLGMRVTLKPKTSYLTTQELGELVCALPQFRNKNEHLIKNTNVWLFTLLTGLRKSSVQNLKWSQVKLRDSITFDLTKNGDSYILPLTPLLNDLLEQQRAITDKSPNPNSEYVFSGQDFRGAVKNVRDGLNRFYSETGIKKKYSPHDLRRTFASLADLAGVSFGDIKHLMIHRKGDITERYMQSQQIKAMSNYQSITEFLASITPIAQYTDERGNAVSHFATPDLLRLVLFSKGRLANHPNMHDPEFLIDQSKAFYNEDIKIDWD